MDVEADRDLALIRKFCTLWHNDAVVNQPIRANAETFECEIGQGWYGEAKARWEAVMQERTPSSAPPQTTSFAATANIGHSNLGPSNLGPSNLGPSNLGPSNLGPANLGPANIAPASIGLGNPMPRSMPPARLGGSRIV
jgi:hypothetical protein